MFFDFDAMPKYCCVYGCYSKSDKNKDLSFHDFPSNQAQAKAWRIRIRREDFQPTKHSYVCSRHFVSEDFTQPSKDTPATFQKRRLKREAIPSLFLRGKCENQRKQRSARTSARACESPVLNKEETRKADDTGSASWMEVDETICENVVLKVDENSTETFQSVKKELKQALMKIKNLEITIFKFENLSESEVKDYTNITKAAFVSLNLLIDRFRPLRYWTGSQVRRISDQDQLLICLMKLKLDLPMFDLAVRYRVSRTTIHNIFLTYLHCLHEILYKGMMKRIPSLSKNRGRMPESFGDFSNCRIIIDCTEFRICTPRKDLNAATLSYSNYKHNLTGKFLIGVAPNGSITFVSDGYPGSTSDKEVTQASGVLSHMKAGDLVLADKGFLLHDLMPQGVSLNLPAFLASKEKFTKAEAVFSRKISQSRIHVERAIERLRNYKILESFPTNLRPFASVVVQACSALVNLQSPIISGIVNPKEESPSYIIPFDTSTKAVIE